MPMDRPIPALYCCYLLRSTVRHGSLYIGSTPHPARRLKQHNGGIEKGGANRTDRITLRPWEMVCLVTGFPSKIAALQFEWAWQRPDVTRHIHSEDRITHSRISKSWSKKRQTYISKVRCPPMTLPTRLSNLHLLLNSPSFRRWPLSVRFYSSDVYAAWQKVLKHTIGHLRSDVLVALEGPVSTGLPDGLKGAAGVDPTYRPMRAQLARSRTLLDETIPHSCSVCNEPAIKHRDLVLVCPAEGCGSTSHLACLSRDFLGPSSAVVPTVGLCRKCGGQQEWSNLVRDLSLRIRGQTVLDALLKPPRANKAATNAEAAETNDEAEERRLGGLIGDEPDDENDDSDFAGDPDEIPTSLLGGRADFVAEGFGSRRATAGEAVVADSESDGWADAEIIV